MQYAITITTQTCNPTQYTHSDSVVASTVNRKNQGTALLNIKDWLTRNKVNANGRRIIDGNAIYRGEFSPLEIGAHIDIFSDEHWNMNFKPGMLDELYHDLSTYNRDIGNNSYHPEWGLKIASIYSRYRPYWESLWIRVCDAQGKEYVDE